MFLPARRLLGSASLSLIALAALSTFLLSGAVAPAYAAEPLSFTVPAEDGYGIGDCMHAGSECGRVMANSWCEAHGHAKAVAYGSAEDVTGSVPTSDRIVQVAAGDVVIRCGD
ncbi:hypothetical protein [Lichenihabitans psoromatis]|uniref:hypothetical protein n=1 Tax=Lichenihabitans psoromatis TaxID=2528642 RepID=UPI0010358432|nr:hypothetical protein [Lichenihabitans psoromatis]